MLKGGGSPWEDGGLRAKMIINMVWARGWEAYKHGQMACPHGHGHMIA